MSMETEKAKILLQNLLHRISEVDGVTQLPGVLTPDEVEALRLVAGAVDPEAPAGPVPAATSTGKELDSEATGSFGRELVLSGVEECEPSDRVRLCFDFGTAMSKATLVRDDDDGELIVPLRLGVVGGQNGQEQGDELLLISSVYIDDGGVLRFGKAAFDKSVLESEDGSRQRLDNIKRRLSEDGWAEQVDGPFNPTKASVTYEDMVLAYLAFMTWAANSCLEDLGYPKTISRRFALPCFEEGRKQRETVERLRGLVGAAQVLADTFGGELLAGVPLVEFMRVVRKLRKIELEYAFVAEDVAEPLGVAGSLISWKQRTDSLILVIDVGAGTTDLGLYRIHVEPDTNVEEGYEVLGSNRVLTEAGNYLDRVLTELILSKIDIPRGSALSHSARGKLNLEIRTHKETLFSEGSVLVLIDVPGQQYDVEVSLDEFRSHPAVQQFGESLRETAVGMLETIDESWIGWIRANPSRSLAVVLTGGGARLPMVRDVVDTPLVVHGRPVELALAPSMPPWLKNTPGDLASAYARVAVSLGGARKRLMKRRAARITGGDVVAEPVIGGYYQKGQG